MQIHELTQASDFDTADYAAIDNGTTTRKINIASIVNAIKSRLGIAESDISTAKSNISALQQDLQTANGNISTNTASINTLNNTTLPAMQSDIDSKVSMTDALLSLDTTQASTTVDGALYAAITALGWASDVIES